MSRMKLMNALVLVFMLSACSKYGYVYLDYPSEPLISLPSDVRSMAVVNRSLTSPEDRKDKTVEAIFTGEIAGSDKLASDECLKGVFAGLDGINGFKVLTPPRARMFGTGTRETPDLMEWDSVAEICNTTGADALLVLETFDSNTDVLISAATEQVSVILSGNKPQPKLPDQIKVNIRSFWRLYDPGSRTIIDQYQQSRDIMFNTAGVNPPVGALPEAAYASGIDYVSRFLPGYYSVRRALYKKGKGPGKQEFKTGFRRSEVANWQGALDTWKDLITHANRVTAGRACLNIAVACEVLGRTDLALEWAQRSYEEYSDKLGRDYAKVLLNRKKIEDEAGRD